MPWFFSNSNTETGYLYYHPDPGIHFLNDNEKDWHWEDGWELLYLNIGSLPNGTPIDQKSDPSMYWNTDSEQPTANNSPYVVLYNRYTGLMRVFFSAWGDDANNWQDVTVSLEFPDQNVNKRIISGIFRHAEGIDRPLNQPTKITKLKGARKQRINGPNEWYVAEFQLGYDVCQCQFASSMLLNFKYTSESSVDLTLRTVELEQGIANMGDEYWNFFQSMYDEEGNLLESGNVLYPTMRGLSSSYESALTKYNDDLEDYNSFENQLKIKAIAALTDGVAGGIAGLVVPQTAVLRDFLLNNQIKLVNGKILLPQDTSQANNWANSIEASAKKALAEESDFISGMLGIKKEPSPPQMPVATFTEGKIKGYITDNKDQTSVSLIVPGSMKSPNGITGQNFPAYNQVVGLFALLETPKFDVSTFEPDMNPYYYPRIVLQLKDIKYALNPALDFDLKKTRINGAVVIETRSNAFEKDSFYDQLPMNYGNFKLNHRYVDQETGYLISQFVSSFYNLEDIKNVIFQLDLMSLSNFGSHGFVNNENIENSILKVDFKIAGDFYFKQIGSNNEQVNTFQVFTYNLYQLNEESNFANTIVENGGNNVLTGNWANYKPGTFELDGIVHPYDDIVWNTSGNNIYIKAENVLINGDVGPAEGYNLIIEAMEVVMDPDASLLENTELKSKWFYGNPKTYPIINSQDLSEGYCSDTYKANSPIANKREIKNEEVQGLPILVDETPSIKVSVYPNPVNQEVNVKVTSGELSSCSIKVISITGQTLIQERVNDDLLNGFAIGVEHLVNGYYILELFSDDGYRIQKKFVVQH